MSAPTSDPAAPYSERCYVCHGSKQQRINTPDTHTTVTCPRCWGDGYITKPPFLNDIVTGRWRSDHLAPGAHP